MSRRCTGAIHAHLTAEPDADRHTYAFSHTHGYSHGDANPTADTDAGARHTCGHANGTRHRHSHAATGHRGADGAAGSPDDARA